MDKWALIRKKNRNKEKAIQNLSNAMNTIAQDGYTYNEYAVDVVDYIMLAVRAEIELALIERNIKLKEIK